MNKKLLEIIKLNYHRGTGKSYKILSLNKTTVNEILFATYKNSSFFLHQIISLYFADLYLLSLDAYHKPQFFIFLSKSPHSEYLKTWVYPFRYSLEKLQEYAREIADQQIYNASETLENNQIHGERNINDLDISGLGPFLIGGIVVLMSVGFCSQQVSNTSPIFNPNPLLSPEKVITTGTIQVTNPESMSISLYSRPGGQTTGSLLENTQVAILEQQFFEDNVWYRVKDKNGIEGWTWSGFVSVDQS
ncbi:MAG: SH3 domain-containing protein [Cyanobacteria bacterium P01_D01_bin.56]